MLWFVLWFLLVAAALTLFALLGLRLYRQAKALTAELSTASHRLAEVSAAMTELVGPAGPDRTDRR